MMNTKSIRITAQDAENNGLWAFLLNELKPKGKIFTPFNIITAPIIVLGLIIVFYRFAYGLGSVSNINQEVPWGLWKGFNVVTGVALAGGAYVLVFMVHILNLKKYKPIARVTVLNGFLAYIFYTGALLIDLGRPLKIFNIIIGNNYGVSSVLFLVGWHFLLYLLALFIEFSPAVAEWLGVKKIRKILSGLTIGVVVFGITLSVLHQAGIGALFLMAKDKIHPLWYNSYIPLMFLVSSVFAGISLVILEGSISSKIFSDQLDKDFTKKNVSIVNGLSKICSVTMFLYLFMSILIFIHQKNWQHFSGGYAWWYMLELVGFVITPMFIYFYGYRNSNVKLIRIASVFTLIGILLNRINISVIAFKWYENDRYIPSWQEFIVTLSIIFIEIWVFRWVVRRMPVLRKSPEWVNSNH